MENNKYQKGKIYKIVDVGYTKCYYGSTTQSLAMRMGDHRRRYKDYKEGKYHNFTVFTIFDEHGVENCKIELVELFPCSSKSELEAREGYYIKNNECLNRCVVGRTKQEYYVDKKEQIYETVKRYYEARKDIILEQKKQYRLANMDKINEWHKEYRQTNRDKLRAQSKYYYKLDRDKRLEKYECPICNAIVCKSYKVKHETSNKHKGALEVRSSETQI